MVRIQFRQNASWQGTVQWLEGKKTLPFRSMLELVHLLREATEMEPGTPETEAQFHTWSDREEVS